MQVPNNSFVIIQVLLSFAFSPSLCVSQEYGDIEYCVIIKNKSTGESKGLGYVRYYKPSQAAHAIENCDKSKIVPNSLTASFACCKAAVGFDPLEVVHVDDDGWCFLAYRAILAEPRTKAAATEDYSAGAARGDYMGAADSMNQYALPLGKWLCTLLRFCPPAVVLWSNLFFFFLISNEWVPGSQQESK